MTEETIIPNLMSVLSNHKEDGDDQQVVEVSIDLDSVAAREAVRVDHSHNNNNHNEPRGPLQLSPTPDTDDSSIFLDPAISSNIANTKTLYEETTSGAIGRRLRGVGRFPSFLSDQSSTNVINNRTRGVGSLPLGKSNSGGPLSPSSTRRSRAADASSNDNNDKNLLIVAETPPTQKSPPGSSAATSLFSRRPHKPPNNSNNTQQQRPLFREPPSLEEGTTNLPFQNSHHTLVRNNSFNSHHTDAAGSIHRILVTRSYEVQEHYWESIFYVSTSAISGSVVRTYLARIFGFDCETRLFEDFLTPLTSQICVTNGGRTNQTGGALFYDFPANVLGSFIMGLISPRLVERRVRFPWLHRDHPLQRDDVFHASLATGFCGCLTTFASWNTQMVVMLDGSYCELGSQVVPVLFGYMVGLMGATCGFQFGRHCK